MVATATGAGTSMRIIGSIDTSNIERGFARVKSGFQNIKAKSASFGSDLSNMSSTVSKLSKRLAALGIAGGTAMVALASKAPAVAPALAKMKVNFDKLVRTLGRALAPAFERVGKWFNKFVDWVGQNEGTIRSVASSVLDFAEKVGNFLLPVLKSVAGWAKENPKLFATAFVGLALSPAIISGIKMLKSLAALKIGSSVLKAIGGLAGLSGGAALAGGGIALAGGAAGHFAERGTRALGVTNNRAGFWNSAGRAGVSALGGAAMGAGIGSVVPGVGTALGAAIGGAGGLIYGGGRELYNYYTNSGPYSQPAPARAESSIEDRRYEMMNDYQAYRG